MIKELKHITLFFNVPLKDFTFTKTGGPVDILALPNSTEELVTLLQYCKKHEICWSVIGHGSNLIVRDHGIRGMVIILNKMNQIYFQGNQLTIEAGAKLIDTSHKAMCHSLTGLEFACGIPGSVGGAIYMNAGAYGGEIKDVLISAKVLLPDGMIKKISNSELQFSYRHSVIEEMKCIILQAEFSLEPGNLEVIKMKMDELTTLRVSKQPLEFPSCGSVFKRPPGYFAGKLIQQAGLQGLKWGGAQVSNKHAGFIVNVDNATATDYIELIEYIQKVIKDKFGVTLQREVRIIGEMKS